MFLHGGEQIAQRRGLFEAHFERGGLHARAQFARELRVPAFQKQPDLPHRLRVSLGRGQPLHAGPQAAVNVVLQAGLRMIAASDPLCRTAPGNAGG